MAYLPDTSVDVFREQFLGGKSSGDCAASHDRGPTRESQKLIKFAVAAALPSTYGISRSTPARILSEVL